MAVASLRLFAFQLFETLLNTPSQIVVESALLRVEIIKQDVFGTALGGGSDSIFIS
jgi:hypothetical protein